MELESRLSDLPAKNRQLVPEHENLELQRRPPNRRGHRNYRRRLTGPRASPNRVAAPRGLLADLVVDGLDLREEGVAALRKACSAFQKARCPPGRSRLCAFRYRTPGSSQRQAVAAQTRSNAIHGFGRHVSKGETCTSTGSPASLRRACAANCSPSSTQTTMRSRSTSGRVALPVAQPTSSTREHGLRSADGENGLPWRFRGIVSVPGAGVWVADETASSIRPRS